MYGPRKIFAGRATHYLAQKICDHLGEPLGKTDVFPFKNDNLFVLCPPVGHPAGHYGEVPQGKCRRRDPINLPPQVTELSVAALLAEAIRHVSTGVSISHLFPY